jgi:hypothetical protein
MNSGNSYLRESKGSLPCLQEHVTGPWPHYFSNSQSNIITATSKSFQWSLPFSFSRPNSYLFLISPCMPHDHPIILDSVASKSLMQSKNYEVLITQFSTAYSYFQRSTTLYGRRLLAPHPLLRLEEHPLSVVHYCLFSVFTASSISCDPLLPVDRTSRTSWDILVF